MSCSSWARDAQGISTKLGTISAILNFGEVNFEIEKAAFLRNVERAGLFTTSARDNFENWHVGCSLNAARCS